MSEELVHFCMFECKFHHFVIFLFFFQDLTDWVGGGVGGGRK